VAAGTEAEYELVSESLSGPKDFTALLGDLSEFLLAMEGPLTIELGFGCNLPIPELFDPLPLVPSQFEEHLRSFEQRGIAQLGTGDIIVRSDRDSTVLNLCHESDIHLTTTNPDLRTRFIDLLAVKKIKTYISVNSVDGPRSWQLALPSRPILYRVDPSE
jgi:hypothetical protein